MSTFTRWKLETLDGLESYTFQINPNAQDSPFWTRGVTWAYNGPTLGFSGSRSAKMPVAWSFSGVLRSQEQYDDLLAWCTRTEKLKLTDDRGDVLTVRLRAFEPMQTAATRNRHAPWRMTYTVRAAVYEVEAAP